MKAVAIDEYGAPEVLRSQDLPIPEIKSDQMLVKVYATSINPIDWKTRKGMLKIIFGNKFPMVLGYDVAGEVVEVGSAVTQFRPGDQIYACLDTATSGSYAEYAAVSEKVAYFKPQNLSHSEAAAIALAAETALQALRDLGEIKVGSRIMINGASGGVGTFAVQIAKAKGAQVTAVCSQKNAELVKSLGADRIIDYTFQDFTKESVKYDIIFDAVANRSFWECQNILSSHGVYVTTVPDFANSAAILITQLIPGKKAKFILLKSNGKDLAYLKELIEANKLRPIIARTYPLSEIAQAHAESEKGRVVGKLVISVSS